MKRKIIIASLVICIAVPMLFLAASPTGGQDSDFPKTLRVVLDTIYRDPDGLTEWCGEFQKVTGVALDIVNPPHSEYSQKLKTFIASGDKIDAMEVLVGDYVEFAQRGVLYPLDDLIANSDIAKCVNPRYLNTYTLADGHIYGFPMNAGGGCVMYLRKDWLDNLGIDVPQTFDEFIMMLRAFTYKDPDRNGMNDTCGYTLPLNVPIYEFDYYNRFFMLDARIDFCVKNGIWVDGFTQPEMAKALERFQTAHREGLIDLGFMINTTSAMRTKYFEGRFGAFEYWSGLWAKRTQDGVSAVNPNGIVIPIRAIQGAHYINRPGPCFAIYAKSEDPKFAFKTWMETSVDKSAGQILFTYGVEGVHYKIDSAGQMAFASLRSNPRGNFEKAYVDPTLMVNDYEPRIPLDPLVSLSREIHIQDSVPLPFVPRREIYGKYAGVIGQIKFRLFTKIVIGESSISAGLATYREQVKELHIDEIIAELNGKWTASWQKDCF